MGADGRSEPARVKGFLARPNGPCANRPLPHAGQFNQGSEDESCDGQYSSRAKHRQQPARNRLVPAAPCAPSPGRLFPPAQWRHGVTSETRFPWPFKGKRLDNVKLFLETEHKMLFDVVFDDEPPGPDNHMVSQDQWRSFVTDHMRVDVKNLPQGPLSEILL